MNPDSWVQSWAANLQTRFPSLFATESDWDSIKTHGELAKLSLQRGRFRTSRMVRRIRSPRRLVATLLAIAFLSLYLLNGIYILSNREAADPAHLRLWLSGGMVIYALYHFARCAWTTKIPDLELTAAEQHWLGGAPLRRSSLAVYHLSNVVMGSLLKTLLLTVVLATDVRYVPLLILGVFTSLVLLESVRLIIERFVSGLGARGRRLTRIAATSIVIAIAAQVIARMCAAAGLGQPVWVYILRGFSSLGETAGSTSIQWIGFPWIATSAVAVTETISALTVVQVFASLALVPLSVFVLVAVDRWATERTKHEERECMKRNMYHRANHVAVRSERTITGGRLSGAMQAVFPSQLHDASVIASRQLVSIRNYAPSIFVSFLVPMLLCLSPLVTGQDGNQWLFVVGSVAFCTLLLAPPALRLDFRRDLKRILLLRGLPVSPIQMVLGQLTLPIAITIIFQLTTLSVAACFTAPGWTQMVLWSGILSGVAAFTFGLENSIFLAYPHHEKSQGIAMIIRAKLAFIGKGTVILCAIGLLVGWSFACRALVPEVAVTAAFVSGGILGVWMLAAVSLWITSGMWRRFDLCDDLPPE